VKVRSKQRYRSILARDIENYVASKRALGCRFDHEESGLQLLDRFLVQQRIRQLDQITRGLLERFLQSRPRRRPQSYNQLLGTVRRLFKRLTAHERMPAMLALPGPRRSTGSRLPFIFNQSSAKRLLDASAEVRDYWNARHRGPTYRVIFTLLYGLGLRVGEVCSLQYHDIDFERQLLVIRCAKFGKSRLVPFGPRVAAALTDHVGRNNRLFRSSMPDAPVFTFNGRTPINRHSINQSSVISSAGWPFQGRPACSFHAPTTSVTRSRLEHCCAGIAPESIRPPVYFICRPLWGMST